MEKIILLTKPVRLSAFFKTVLFSEKNEGGIFFFFFLKFWIKESHLAKTWCKNISKESFWSVFNFSKILKIRWKVQKTGFFLKLWNITPLWKNVSSKRENMFYSKNRPIWTILKKWHFFFWTIWFHSDFNKTENYVDLKNNQRIRNSKKRKRIFSYFFLGF